MQEQLRWVMKIVGGVLTAGVLALLAWGVGSLLEIRDTLNRELPLINYRLAKIEERAGKIPIPHEPTALVGNDR